jgi:type IV pilus assembly protein PilO
MANDNKQATKSKLDLTAIADQFKTLDRSQPANWPLYPRLLLYIAVAIAVLAAGWFLYLNTVEESLKSAITQEATLKDSYLDKYSQAVNLDALEEQRKQVQRYVTQLEKQLPNKAEMDALLSDINQAGLGRGLQFDLFKPGVVVAKQYYAELPIDVKVNGKYHDIGQFAADIASLSRIVTLNNIAITPEKDGSLGLSSTVKTFRYLDPDEAKSAPKTEAKN